MWVLYYMFIYCADVYTLNKLIFESLAENAYPYFSTNNGTFGAFFFLMMYLTANIDSFSKKNLDERFVLFIVICIKMKISVGHVILYSHV